MSSTALWIVIAILVGVIVGGAGGAAIIRSVVKKTGISSNLDPGEVSAYADSAKAAAHAAEAASEVAKVFRETVTTQFAAITASLNSSNEKLDKLNIDQTKLTAAVNQFPLTCTEKHRRTDENQERMQQEINEILKDMRLK